MPTLCKRTALKLIRKYNRLEPLRNMVDCAVLHCCLQLPSYEFELLANYTRGQTYFVDSGFDAEFARSYKIALQKNPTAANKHAKMVLSLYRPPWDAIYKFSRVEYAANPLSHVTYWYVTNYPSGWKYSIAGKIESMYIIGFKDAGSLAYIEKLYNVKPYNVVCPVAALRFMHVIERLPYHGYIQYEIPDLLFVKLLDVADENKIVDWIAGALSGILFGCYATVFRRQLLLMCVNDVVYYKLQRAKCTVSQMSIINTGDYVLEKQVSVKFSGCERHTIERNLLTPLMAKSHS